MTSPTLVATFKLAFGNLLRVSPNLPEKEKRPNKHGRDVLDRQAQVREGVVALCAFGVSRSFLRTRSPVRPSQIVAIVF